MISGANEEQLDIANDRADLLLEIERLNKISKECIEDIFTLLRVLNVNVKELKCSDEELKVINKYTYNRKENTNES